MPPSPKPSPEEATAAAMLAEIGRPMPPISGFGLAEAWGFRVRLVRGVNGACWQDSKIRVCRGLSTREQSWHIATAIAEWGLWRRERPVAPDAAQRLADALLLPRDVFSSDLRATLWDPRALAAIHLYCPIELIARRLVYLRSACAAVWIGGAIVSRHWSPWLPESYARVTVLEREMAADALVQGCTLRGPGLSWAVVAGRRVITVVEAEAVEMQEAG